MVTSATSQVEFSVAARPKFQEKPWRCELVGKARVVFLTQVTASKETSGNDHDGFSLPLAVSLLRPPVRKGQQHYLLLIILWGFGRARLGRLAGTQSGPPILAVGEGTGAQEIRPAQQLLLKASSLCYQALVTQ